LIKCGAFDEVGEGRDARGMARPEMLWRWNILQAGKSARPRVAVPRGGPKTLFAEASGDDAIGAALAGMPAVDYTQEKRLRYEREILEVCVSGHHLDFLPRNGEVWSDELDGMRGKRVTLCGWVVTYRHVGTKNYRNMMFVTLEDQRGLYEVVLFPDAYDRYGGLVFETRAMRVTGRVEIGGQINGEKMEALKK
jgi:DNA polymerase III alpha subunit